MIDVSAEAVRQGQTARQVAGYLFLFGALVTGLALFGVITDYATRTWRTDYEVDEHRISMALLGLLLVIVLSTGVALVRSGRIGGRVSRLFFVGAWTAAAGLVAAYVLYAVALATLTSIEPLWTVLPFAVPVAGIVLMAIGSLLPPSVSAT